MFTRNLIPRITSGHIDCFNIGLNIWFYIDSFFIFYNRIHFCSLKTNENIVNSRSVFYCTEIWTVKSEGIGTNVPVKVTEFSVSIWRPALKFFAIAKTSRPQVEASSSQRAKSPRGYCTQQSRFRFLIWFKTIASFWKTF